MKENKRPVINFVVSDYVQNNIVVRAREIKWYFSYKSTYRDKILLIWLNFARVEASQQDKQVR